MYDQKSKIIIPTPSEQITEAVSWTNQGTGEQVDGVSWAQADGVSWAVQTWGSIDDTELPLDQNSPQAAGTQQATDPEVEEIIDLLEELIAESEAAQ
jgi:hypothetical protein